MTRKEVLHIEDMVMVDKAVRIAGTSYDRRRKLDNRMVYNIKQSYKAGKSLAEIADRYGVAPSTIRYWVDDEYKEWKNKERNKYAHNTEQDSLLDSVERGCYKMYLVKKRRAVIYK